MKRRLSEVSSEQTPAEKEKIEASRSNVLSKITREEDSSGLGDELKKELMLERLKSITCDEEASRIGPPPFGSPCTPQRELSSDNVAGSASLKDV